jgi:hypothetical protein
MRFAGAGPAQQQQEAEVSFGEFSQIQRQLRVSGHDNDIIGEFSFFGSVHGGSLLILQKP